MRVAWALVHLLPLGAGKTPLGSLASAEISVTAKPPPRPLLLRGGGGGVGYLPPAFSQLGAGEGAAVTPVSPGLGEAGLQGGRAPLGSSALASKACSFPWAQPQWGLSWAKRWLSLMAAGLTGSPDPAASYP